MPTTKLTPLLLISHRNRSRYTYVELRPVYRNSEGKIRNFSTTAMEDEPWAGLLINGMISGPVLASTTPDWRYGYEGDNFIMVEPRTAAAMHKLLSGIERKAKRAIERYGYPADWKQHLEYITTAMGVNEFLWNTAPWPGGDHDHQPYQFGGFAAALGVVETIINVYAGVAA
jgi:hypothetical protein